MDIDSIMDGAAKNPKKSKKNTVPVMMVTDNKVKKAIVAFVRAKEQEKTAKANICKASEDIVPVAEKFHEAESISRGDVPASVKLQVKDGASVTVDVAKQQYSKIPIDQEEELRDLFGEDFDNYFEKVRTVQLSAKAIKDVDIMTKLIKAVGKERFHEFFEVVSSFKPKPAFHVARFIGKEDKQKARSLINEGKVVPFNPAVKA